VKAAHCFLLVAFLLLSACSGPQESETDDSAQQLAMARGAALYAGSCSEFCHGASPTQAGAGTAALRATDAPDLFDCVWLQSQSDRQIEEIIVNGVEGSRMLGYGDNFPEGSRDHARLIAYLRNTAACETQQME
jgi:mono/diheme cytochrome c family protein